MDLSELIQSIDIVEYISQFIELEQRGDEWWGLSCFTNEKTPSFSVRKDPPFFYDYSSGFGGNAFTFTKKYYSCSSAHAVEKLKSFAGYSGNVDMGSDKLDIVRAFKRYKLPELSLKQSTASILPPNHMDMFENNANKLQIWRDEGISDESLERFQVRYDSFTNRIVYPIRNMDGDIINVGGRTLDPDFKSKGYRKYTYFQSWGTINTIYGVSENMEYIKKKREVILFEGCKSVLLADTWGIKNCGAILTSHLSQNQMIILAKLGCNVVFALDKDVNVRKDENIQRLKRYTNVYTLWDKKNLLDDKDAPVDKGEEVFRTLYEERNRLK